MGRELSTEKTMTIKEVAEILGVDQSTIRKRAKALYPLTFNNGKTTYLSEYQVTRIKMELFDKNPNLGRVSEVKTDLEKELLIQQAMMLQAEKIKSMQTRLEIAEPKARLADEAIRDKSKQYSIRDAGKHIGLSQKKIFVIMREKGLLTKKNLPSQKALEYNVLELRTNIVEGKNRPQSVMSMENILNFKERYC